MKESLISKIVISICLICLIVGFLSIDKSKLYVEDKQNNISSNKKIMTNANKIAVLELEGVISSSYENNFFSQESNAANLLKQLQSASLDNDIKGIIIKVNSPGGTVAMSQNIYNQIMKIRKTKPVIIVMDDVAASGGYYIASAADRIIAQEGTLTGSIGVIFSFMDYHNLLAKKLDIKPVVIKSGKYKDIASSTREMTQEERELMQDIINDSYSQFVNAIKNGRIARNDNYSAVKTALTEQNLKSNADGRVFTGTMAKKLGFVDEIGDIDTAQEMITKMAQEKYSNKLPAKLIKYNKKSSFNEYFSGFAEYNSKSYIKLTDLVPTSMILNRKP
ncbi:MAG: signal peptide peptidase SppA, partial [Candidatus Gastranaerophilales bacterium]|nr:signal peptide peptidase SppA [Candidatus Gastranaerophilales bacterium]